MQGGMNNHDFRPISRSLYLTNDARWNHSYYGRRIGNCTQAFEWYQFDCLNDLWSRFQGHDIIQRQVTRKWYKIELCLQWQTNRKSLWSIERCHFQWPSTNTNPVFKVTPFFDADNLRNRIWFIKRCHIQWSWTTPDPVFKVTLFFDAEYLIRL